jgi:hypothetical protein
MPSESNYTTKTASGVAKARTTTTVEGHTKTAKSQRSGHPTYRVRQYKSNGLDDQGSRTVLRRPTTRACRASRTSTPAKRSLTSVRRGVQRLTSKR